VGVKTKKSFLKRFKITRTGKILRRATGQNHYRAKKTGKRIRQSRKWVVLAPNEAKVVKRLIGKI
jgi:large subunit ribosomal protein L35